MNFDPSAEYGQIGLISESPRISQIAQAENATAFLMDCWCPENVAILKEVLRKSMETLIPQSFRDKVIWIEKPPPEDVALIVFGDSVSRNISSTSLTFSLMSKTHLNFPSKSNE